MLSVSVVIPCFKRVKQTKKTIETLLKSKGQNRNFSLQLIIADATPDKSLKKMVDKISYPLTYTRPQKPGIASNKNKGAKLARHELLIFCDSDMEVEKDAILNALNSLKSRPKTAMLTGQIIWKKGKKVSSRDRPRQEDRIIKIGNEQYLEAIYSRFLITYKSIFNKVGGYNEDLFNMRGEGSDLSIRYWRSGFPLGYDPKVKVYHIHDAPNAVTRNIDHPERGIIRDLIQLGFLYGLDQEKSTNFAKTLNWLKKDFGSLDKYIILESIVNLLPHFWENKAKLKKTKKNIPQNYDFKFLDIFTQKKLFKNCLQNTQKKLQRARITAFKL